MKKNGKYNVNRLLAVAGGGLASVLVNNLVKQYTDGMDKEKRQTAAKIISLVKIGAGVYIASQKDQMISDAGLGVVAEGAVEAAMKFAPNQFQIGGLYGFFGDEGGFYDDIGSTAYNTLPLDAAGTRLLSEDVSDNHQVLGNYEYESVPSHNMAVI